MRYFQVHFQTTSNDFFYETIMVAYYNNFAKNKVISKFKNDKP